MRADRLISLLLLLQVRGRMSARQLAENLEVSERTIYRDILALSTAGVPIYGLPGPDGGFELVESYRTSLTGLSQGEAQALGLLPVFFDPAVPAALANLGLDRELKAALRKLNAALPEKIRSEERRLQQRFYFDAHDWDLQNGAGGERVRQGLGHLAAVHTAVMEDRWLQIAYQPLPIAPIKRRVQPYGLVVKDGDWFLVYQQSSRMRVIRVADLLDARLEAERFERAGNFDLRLFWEQWRVQESDRRASYTVCVRAPAANARRLTRYFGSIITEQLNSGSPVDDGGMVRLQLAFASHEAARTSLITLGALVEVLEPQALRLSLEDLASQVVQLYRDRS